MIEIFNEILANNSFQNWIIAVSSLVLAIFILLITRRVILKRAAAFARRTENQVDDLVILILENTKLVFILVFAIFIGSRFLVLPSQITEFINILTGLMFFFQLGFWGNGAISFLIKERVQNEMEEDDAATATSLSAFGIILKIALWSLIVLIALDNIPGVEVNSLIASLGIGGIAVALAVQNILGDLFASLLIALDKPFIIGDFIEVGSMGGSVERIGLKSTHLRALSGEQLVFSNSDLLNSRIRNYKRMENRRVVVSIGVTYQTSHEKLSSIPKFIQEIVEEHEMVTFDRAHLKEFGDSAINFEVVFTLGTPDYAVYMDTRQSISLKLFKKFEVENIEFAYPTQTVFIEQDI